MIRASQTELKGPLRGVTEGEGGGGLICRKMRYVIFERHLCCRNSYNIVHYNDISFKYCLRTGINWSLRCLNYVLVRRLNRLQIHDTPNLGVAKTNDLLPFRLLLRVCIGLSGKVTNKLQSLFRVQDRSWAGGSISSRWALEHH